MAADPKEPPRTDAADLAGTSGGRPRGGEARFGLVDGEDESASRPSPDEGGSIEASPGDDGDSIPAGEL